MKHPLQKMMEDRRNGIKAGIPSYCTANPLVLEMALRRAKKLGRPGAHRGNCQSGKSVRRIYRNGSEGFL